MNLSHLPQFPAKITLPDGTVMIGTLMRVSGRSEEGDVQELTLLNPAVPAEVAPGDRYLVVYVLPQTFSCHREAAGHDG